MVCTRRLHQMESDVSEFRQCPREFQDETPKLQTLGNSSHETLFARNSVIRGPIAPIKGTFQSPFQYLQFRPESFLIAFIVRELEALKDGHVPSRVTGGLPFSFAYCSRGFDVSVTCHPSFCRQLNPCSMGRWEVFVWGSREALL